MIKAREEMIRATVVIPSRNRRPLLEKQLGCLLAQETDGFDYEIVVVNDASTDDTGEFLRGMEKVCPRLRVIHRDVIGSTAARNDGVRIARGDLILCADDDCEAPPGWVAAYVRAFDAHPDAAGIRGPTTCPSEGISPWTRQIISREGNPLYHSCNIGYRKTVLDAVGGFNEQILFGFGDVEIAARILEVGEILWIPSAEIVHPPRPRTYRSECEWLDTLNGEWRLWRRCREFYRRTRAPHFLLGVLGHWVLGSTAKDLCRHAKWAIRRPAAFLAFAREVIREKLRLLSVLPGFWAEHNPRRTKRFPPPSKPLHVCYFGTYRKDYSRNRILIEGLRRNDVKVTECHCRLWQGVEDRVETVRGGWRRLSFLGRVLAAYVSVLIRQFGVRDYDVLMVGYPGQFDVYPARVIAFLRRRPLVWDVFMSIYLVAKERGLAEGHPGTTDLLRILERTALRLPNLLIQDTAEYVRWLGGTHGVRPDRFRLVPTGADDRVFRGNGGRKRRNGIFRVHFHGTFIPNHGVDVIVRAALLLESHSDIRFELIGDGPTRALAEEIAREHHLRNISFPGWMEHGELVRSIEQADVCLGSFGATPQSLMTVQNKIFEALAMERAVISGDGPAVRDALRHGRDVYLVNRLDHEDLARAILHLRDNPRLLATLEREGRRRFRECYSVEAIGRRTRRHLIDLLPSGCRREFSPGSAGEPGV